MITPEEVLRIAALARIKVTDEKSVQYAKDLSGILDFFADLQEVNTDDVAETSQVTGLENATRADMVEVDGKEDQLLECAPHTIEDHSVRIPKIM